MKQSNPSYKQLTQFASMPRQKPWCYCATNAEMPMTTAIFWYFGCHHSDMYDSYQELQYGYDTPIKSHIQTQIHVNLSSQWV